ncbi:hypothetical protein GCM10011313_18550 [Mycetocola zhadangensis]|nr:hypothetical protein GCM10011313_18550 [Mycetocola zhadangensis]
MSGAITMRLASWRSPRETGENKSIKCVPFVGGARLKQGLWAQPGERANYSDRLGMPRAIVEPCLNLGFPT